MRTFIAIDLPRDIKDYLAGIQDKLKSPLPKINWVKPVNLHLSLKFIGEISLKQIPQVQEIIAAITKNMPPFEIKLENLGVFPSYRQPRIIWLGSNSAPVALKQLAEQLEKKFQKTLIPAEQRLFQAHITLGRIKHPLSSVDLKKTLDKTNNDFLHSNFKFIAKEIVLFQSVLGPGGSTYHILKKETLAGLPLES